MKTIKKNTTATTTLKDRFQVGMPITWTTNFFDGRGGGVDRHEGTVVKVNRVTVDVDVVRTNGHQRTIGDTVRLAWDQKATVR